MDFLEKRIREHREEFDHIERVDEGLLWQSIQADLAPPQQEAKVVSSNRFLKMYAVAASVALLMMASWMFFNQQQPAEIVNTQPPVQNFVPEFEEEVGYRQTVSETMEEMDFQSIDRTAHEDIFYELEMLETIHNEFREDLPCISDKERVVAVLQKYYERKLRILERLSKEIEKKTRNEKRINERPM
jgi:hypothetical protein